MAKQSQPELLSCPCCGGTAVLRYRQILGSQDLFWIECSKCGLHTFEEYRESRAIYKWNRRVSAKEVKV